MTQRKKPTEKAPKDNNNSSSSKQQQQQNSSKNAKKNATTETLTTTVTGSSNTPATVKNPKRRKRSSKRRQKERDRQHHATRKTPKGPPHPPQWKVHIRNIHNATQYRTVQILVEKVLVPLVDRSNQRLLENEKMVMDTHSIQAVIDAEVKAIQARKEWETSLAVLSGVAPKEDVVGDGLMRTGNAVDETKPMALSSSDPLVNDNNNNNSHTSNNQDTIEEKKEIAVLQGLERLGLEGNKDSFVTVRVIYVVPPKYSQRRGEKPGSIYLVLQTPPILSRDGSKEPDGIAPDYSKDVARCRLMLQRALDAMIKVAQEDAKSQQDFALCQVELAPSVKTWTVRTSVVRNRNQVEGTLEQSVDYKEFLERVSKEAMERKSRPKPAPGGGTTVSSAMQTAGENQVAAIVLHLRKKKEEEKKKKNSKGKPSGKAKKKDTNDGSNNKKASKRRNKKPKSKKDGHSETKQVA